MNERTTADILKRSAILQGVVMALSVWLLELLGTFTPFDILAYEGFMRWNARLARKASSILLIECNPGSESNDADSFAKLLAAVEELEADQVVFTFFPANVSAEFYEEAARYGNVVFGQHLHLDDVDPADTRLSPLPPATRGLDIPSGLVCLPPATHGIAREQYTLFPVHDQRLPTLELVAARRRLGSAVPARTDPYLVNFRGGAGSIPHVTVERVLAGGLVRELVQGQTVIIGPALGAIAPGVFTPTTSSDQPMSLLEFQGHALDTLLSGRVIRALSPASVLVILVLASICCALLFQWLEIRLAFWLGVALLAFYAVLTLALLVGACLWLPIVDLVLTQCGCFMLVFRKKSVASYRTVNRLLRSLSSEARDRYFAPNFYTSPEHWTLVANFVTQTLDLNRLIFLEKVDRQHRVREVKSFNCTFDDIHESRRDYTRTPYLTAIEAQSPVRVDESRLFFKKTGMEEHHYLAPLTFAGQVLGFWVLAITPAKAAAIPNFEKLLRDFAEQIAELLYRRQQIVAEQSEGHLWKKLLAFTSEGEMYQELGKKAALLERRLGRIEKLFAELDTPLIIYDLFGRVKEVSSAMREFLVTEELLPYESTAVDMVSALTGNDLGVSRRCLRHVIIEKGQIVLPIKPRKHSGNYVLKLSPLELMKKGSLLDDPAPFNLSGIRCELLDRTLLTQLDKLKEKIAQRMGVHLRNDLATIEFSASLFAAEELSPDERQELARTIHGKVQRAVDTLADCEQFFAVDAHLDADRLPVDTHAVFEHARHNVEALAREQQVNLLLEQPQILNYVLGSPEPLRQLFEHVLAFLIREARGQSTVRVHVEESDPWITYRFQNSGFGMSNERFQAYLFGSEEVSSDEFKNLRTGLQHVQLWGGKVEAGSTVGAGTFIHVSLRKFG